MLVLLAAGLYSPDLGAIPIGRGGTGAPGTGDLVGALQSRRPGRVARAPRTGRPLARLAGARFHPQWPLPGALRDRFGYRRRLPRRHLGRELGATPAGVVVRPFRGWSFGLSARPGEPVHAAGTLDVTPPSACAAALELVAFQLAASL